MKITATEEYGMRCMLQLALQQGRTVSLSELAAAEGIAVPFAAKVLLRLRRAGLVAATRGRHGGYVLTADPQRITVLRVLEALGKPLFDSTFCRDHGSPDASACTRLTDCSLRPVWAHLDALLKRFFENATLADLAAGERRADRHLQERWPLTVPDGWREPAGVRSRERGA
ncbi:MAG TPA: Rrf2 family transcriptional regulator [Thermoanaerobaculaceae bacterium]|nr:Rrf2 family transcriptional regulator [Thermoanaerobaculaceae bacterium]